MIEIIIGALVGYKLGDRFLSADQEVPIWTGHLDADLANPAVIITHARSKGKESYRLYIASDGQHVKVGEGTYPYIVSILGSWETFIKTGGTVQKWLIREKERGAEIAFLEKSLSS